MQNIKTKSETILITGASSGIGRELAYVAAEDGYRNFVLVARSQELLEKVALELKQKHECSCLVIALDLSQVGAAAKLDETLLSRNAHVDILINNAGFGLKGPYLESDAARESEMIRLNVLTLVELTKRWAPRMAKKGNGKILNLASVAAFLPGPSMAVYFASKAFVLSYSEALAQEFRQQGVTVTALCPGSTVSEFHRIAGTDRVQVMRHGFMQPTRVVATAGWRALMRGQVVCVPGWYNQVTLLIVKLLPRSWVRALAARVL